MNVNDVINNHENFLGKTVSLQGIIWLASNKMLYVVQEMEDIGCKQKSLQLLDGGLRELVHAKLDGWIGGPVYQDPVELIGDVANATDIESPLGIRNLSHLILRRRDHSYDII